jgi:sulfur carrier protein
MHVHVNGEPRAIGAAVTLRDIWDVEAEALGVDDPRGFAAAVNGKLVPKARWPETPVADGDRIEIIRAMSGG